jgi:hypothetical protein
MTVMPTIQYLNPQANEIVRQSGQWRDVEDRLLIRAHEKWSLACFPPEADVT